MHTPLHSCLLIIRSVCIAGDEEFDELCFEFGLELDEIVSRIVGQTLKCFC